ncbi:hypothetical protein GGF46_000237 [Coemansia sp. RSA 552]|nr:hypothetical protein GGF46_000237 [Coemansia sp. RSA 552]
MTQRGRQRQGPRLNVGGTLQSSMSAVARRRSAAGTGPWARVRARGASAQARQSINDEASVDYRDLDELFREDTDSDDSDGSPPVVARATSGELASARLNMLSAQKADASGNLQPLPTRRQMFGMYLDASPAGRRWDQVDALLNTAIAGLHVYNTTRLKPGRLGVPVWSLAMEAALSGLLLLQFLPRYFLAPDPLEYLRSLFSIISLITALTPLAVVAHVLIDPEIGSTFMSAGPWVFLYPVIFWRLQPALLRCLVPIKNIYRMSAMTRNVLRALTTVFTTVLAITVLTHIMVFYQNKDKEGSEIEGFDEALFFIAVSAITGLSSDIEPDTWFTRGVVLFVMFIGIFWLPPRVAEMLSLWQDRSPWPSYFQREMNQTHILVIGDLEYTTLFEFLREFFCEDHGIRTVNTVVVVMSESSPSKEVGDLLNDPSYVNRVKFVLGSPTSFSQLESVEAAEAQAVFLLSNKAAGDNAAKEDAAKVMVALAVRKFLRTRRGTSQAVPIYAQVLLPETTMHMEYLAEHVICIEELRLGLLAKSVMVPGFASLLQLLTSSIPSTITDPLIRTAARGRKTWLTEYAQSMSHEIYRTRLSPIFAGVKFQRAAQTIFQRTGATLFALYIPDRVETVGDEGRIVINPFDYELNGDELGFVITANALASVQIAYLAEDSAVDMDANNGDDDDNDGGDETEPLLSGVPISDSHHAATSPVPQAGSPLKALLDTHIKSTMPFGRNVMDTVVVSDTGNDGSEHLSVMSRSRAGSRLTDHHSDNGDAGRSDDEHLSAAASSRPTSNVLAAELAGISVDEDESSKQKKSRQPSGNSSDSGSGESQNMERAPLLFEPKTKRGSDGIESDGSSDRPRLFGQRAAQTPDGLPGDLRGHVVVCDSSAEFPSNIIYLVSCIRSAAPSEVSSIADSAPVSTPASGANPFASLYEQISRSYNTGAGGARAKKPDGGQAFLNTQPIVVLAPSDPSSEQRTDLERFGHVYFVAGSPLARTDLARARIHTASSAVVLANREEWLDAAADSSTQQSLTGADTTATAKADAPALLSVLNIESLAYGNADFFLSVEFIHRENMQFVGDTETLKINEVFGQAFLRPSFMSGRVYAPVMLDTLVCQTYYNEHLLDILQQLIFSHGNVTHALGIAKLRDAGIDSPAPVAEPTDPPSASHSFLVEVPQRFHRRSYASLFSYCCFQHKAIAIGLYRAARHHSRPLWYVMPNPAPDCVLRQNDRVYLLANSRPVLE